jgi:DNA-binding CsgD family transcriptional regulator
MDLNTQIENQISQIANLWSQIHAETNDTMASGKYLQTSSIFNDIANLNNQIILITNFKKHQFLSISDNFNDIYEYDCSLEECLKWGMFYFFRSLPFSQIKDSYLISNWFSGRKKQLIENPQYIQNYCGWRFKSRRTGKIKILLGSLQGLEYGEKGEPIVVMTTVRDVTHLMKENGSLWSRIRYEKGESNIYSYHAETSKVTQRDILTIREFEFLKSFEMGHELKEIAEQMQISYKTADSHRIKILDRLGARNPMAALEVIKYCKIDF